MLVRAVLDSPVNLEILRVDHPSPQSALSAHYFVVLHATSRTLIIPLNFQSHRTQTMLTLTIV
jgi:hypothetical protein